MRAIANEQLEGFPERPGASRVFVRERSCRRAVPSNF